MALMTWSLILTVLVTIGIVMAILRFERPRARRIEEDLRRPHVRGADQDEPAP